MASSPCELTSCGANGSDWPRIPESGQAADIKLAGPAAMQGWASRNPRLGVGSAPTNIMAGTWGAKEVLRPAPKTPRIRIRVSPRPPGLGSTDPHGDGGA